MATKYVRRSLLQNDYEPSWFMVGEVEICVYLPEQLIEMFWNLVPHIENWLRCQWWERDGAARFNDDVLERITVVEEHIQHELEDTHISVSYTVGDRVYAVWYSFHAFTQVETDRFGQEVPEHLSRLAEEGPFEYTDLEFTAEGDSFELVPIIVESARKRVAV